MRLRQSEERRANRLETSYLETVRWAIYITNSVVKPKLSCNMWFICLGALILSRAILFLTTSFSCWNEKRSVYHSIIIFHFHNNQTSLDVLCDIEVFSVLIYFAADAEYMTGLINVCFIYAMQIVSDNLVLLTFFAMTKGWRSKRHQLSKFFMIANLLSQLSW